MICRLCPRECGVDREKAVGFCNVGEKSFVARAGLHMWEEPFLSGKQGSGTIFFCGCNLRCVFCQNSDISTKGEYENSVSVDAESLCDIMLRLQSAGAHNINFVTPTPHTELIAEAIPLARRRGLKIPTAFNTNSYITVESLKKLDGLIDIYMPDLKYVTGKLAKLISGAEDYPEYAKAAIEEMYRQCGGLSFDENGMAVHGVLIRHLVLPGNVDETRRVLDYISQSYPKGMYISLMSQYFPAHMAYKMPPLDRRLLPREYKRAADYARDIGFTNILTQKLTSADEGFVPKWGEIVGE